MKLASWSVYPVVDAVPAPVETSWSFPSVPAEAWASVELSGLDPEGRFQPNLGCFLVRSVECTILCDAGIGPGPNAYLGGLSGMLPERLEELGVTPDGIDIVVFTHLHMDHIGWSLRREEEGSLKPVFPNATYVANEAEFRFWAADPQSAHLHHRDAFHTSIAPLARIGRLALLGPGQEITAGVHLLDTPGHTPGHCSILFEGAEAAIVVAGDIAHCPAQISQPGWCHRADMDPDRARASRKAFIDQATERGWTIACGHFRDGLQLGRIERDGDTARYRPLTSVAKAE